MTEHESELLGMIKELGRVSVFDVPTKYHEAANALLDRNVILKKIFCYDTEYKEHLSTYYLIAK